MARGKFREPDIRATLLRVLNGFTLNSTARINIDAAPSDKFEIAPVPDTAESYRYGFRVNSDGFFLEGAALKHYMVMIQGDRESDQPVTGDSNDAYLRVSGNNYAANDSNFILRGINIGINQRSGGTLGTLEAGSFGAQNKSGGTAPTIRGLTVVPENYGTCATEFGGIDIVMKNEGAAATTEYGLRIRNLNNSIASAVDAAIQVTDTGANIGWTYILDAYGATVQTAHIRFGQTSGEDIVLAVGNFADAADSGFAPGSIGLDTTDGLLFICDSSGLWQQVAIA